MKTSTVKKPWFIRKEESKHGIWQAVTASILGTRKENREQGPGRALDV